MGEEEVGAVANSADVVTSASSPPPRQDLVSNSNIPFSMEQK
jgi:hypothetical protein